MWIGIQPTCKVKEIDSCQDVMCPLFVHSKVEGKLNIGLSWISVFLRVHLMILIVFGSIQDQV